MSNEGLEAPQRSPGTAAETPFYISAKAFSARPRRILKHGDTFAVFDLAIHRHGEEVSVRVVRSSGEVRVSVVYS